MHLRKLTTSSALLVFLILGLMLAATGCPAAEAPDEEVDDDPEEVDEDVDEDPDVMDPAAEELIVGVPAGMRSPHPGIMGDLNTQIPMRNVYEALIRRDENMELQPLLATSWEALDDVTWEFELREGVEFHDGTEFTAEDVEACVNWILEPENAAAWAHSIELIEEVNVVDDHTVQFVTEEPFPTLPNMFAQFLMWPAHVVDESEEFFGENWVGTGPYQLSEWRRDEHIRLEANDNYWGGDPPVQKVEFRPIPEDGTRQGAFYAGEIDVAFAISVDAVPEVEAVPHGEIASVPGTRVVAHLFQLWHEDEPYMDKRVRQAFNYAVDVDEIMETILEGFAYETPAYVSDLNPHKNPNIDPYGFDPDKAVELIREAGYEPEDIDHTIHTCSGRYIRDADISEAIASYLSDIGINVDIQRHEWATYLEGRDAKDHVGSALWGVLDNTSDGPSYFGKRFIEAQKMSIGFYDPELDQKVTEAMQIMDPDEREAASWEIEEWIHDFAPMIFLFNYEDIYAHNSDYEFNPKPDQLFRVFWDMEVR